MDRRGLYAFGSGRDPALGALVIDVTGTETTVGFYAELLGLEVTREAEVDGRRMVWVGSEDGRERQLRETDRHNDSEGDSVELVAELSERLPEKGRPVGPAQSIAMYVVVSVTSPSS
ncbi:MAG: hypothetical protein ABEI27_00785 [Halobellus sp.]|uniref:hypothetical protein n=1 Tax=Halobellus sp. TaxID=1979212 RepID=UPI0035D49C93